jgi:hypothetical protein
VEPQTLESVQLSRSFAPASPNSVASLRNAAQRDPTVAGRAISCQARQLGREDFRAGILHNDPTALPAPYGGVRQVWTS